MGRGRLDRWRQPARLALIGWLVVVLILTLSPNPGRGQSLNLQPGADLAYGRAMLNLAVNVLLFLPFGALAGLAHLRLGSWWRAPLIAALLSSGIEVAQHYGEAGRAADINDVIANTFGTALGVGLTVILIRSRDGRRMARTDLADTPAAR